MFLFFSSGHDWDNNDLDPIAAVLALREECLRRATRDRSDPHMGKDPGQPQLAPQGPKKPTLVKHEHLGDLLALRPSGRVLLPRHEPASLKVI